MVKRFLLIFTLFCLSSTALAIDLKLNYEFKGISGAPLTNVKNSLEAAQKAIAPPLTTTKIKDLYQQAPSNIIKALEPYGFFHATVRSQLRYGDNEWIASFVIKPGPVTRIISLQLSLSGPGKNNKALQRFRKKVPKKLGKTLNTVEYDKVKQRFFDIAQNQGYLKANFVKHKIQINKQLNTARIVLDFNTGPRYYFGAVIFSKNPMSLAFLKRYIPFKAGSPYSNNKLLDLQSNLSSAIYFKRVRVVPQTNKTKHYTIPVKVHLKASKAHQYNFGLGYGTDTGVRGSVGWEWRRVTRTGHYLQALLQVSQKQENNIQLRYVIPGSNPVTDNYNLTAGYLTDNPGNDQYKTAQVGASYINVRHGWQRTLGLQYQHELFTVDGVDGKSDTLIPSIAFEHIRAHNRINTRNGYRINIILQAGAVAKFNASFLQAEVRGKYIRSFHQQNQRIVLRTDLGITYVKDFNDMPLSQRFFAGGAQSIRGYSYQDLGPGRYLYVGSAEFQNRLHGNFYGAVFYDAGDAIQNLPLSIKQSVGIGILYRSPIGPLELTVGHPLDQKLEFKRSSLDIQFSMGPDL